jgi:hypothetical protein
LAQAFDDKTVTVDRKVFNPARIWKLYGTLACKGDNTGDRPHRVSRILWTPDTLNPVSRELLEELAQEAAKPKQPRKTPPRHSRGSFDLDAWIVEHGLELSEPRPYKDGRRWVFEVCPWNSDHTGGSAFLIQFGNGAIAAGCHHDGCKGKNWHALRDMYEPGWRENPQRPQDDTSARIAIHPEISKVVDEALDALARTNADVFHRGGMLVRIVRDASRLKGVVRSVGTPRIDAMPPAHLRELMSASAEWGSWVKDESWKQALVPNWAVEAIMARGYWPMLRRLAGVIEGPVLRQDGSVLDQPGYDSATELLLIPNVAINALPESPAHQDAIKARDTLLEVVCDFPFRSRAHKAAWLACVLTPFARYAYEGPTPLFLIDANVRASGKSLQADVIGEIVLGRPMCRMAPSENEPEERKRITSIALAADRLVLIDNVINKLGTAALDAALTGRLWKDRILGTNQTFEGALSTIWLATGNNVMLAGDTPRRVCHIRLESLREQPEARTDFKHPELIAVGARKQAAPRDGGVDDPTGLLCRGQANTGGPSLGLL